MKAKFFSYKQIRAILFSVIFLFFSWTISSRAQKTDEDPPLKLNAQSAVLMDGETGRVLYGKEENLVRPMASTTKIMTCILVLENGNLEDEVTVSSYAASQPKVHLGAPAGRRFCVGDLLFSLMLESHNDTAVMLAEYLAGDVKAFAAMMNQKARELGLSSSARFANCIGLYDPDNVCTVYDMAMILWAAMENNVCRTFLTERNRVLPPNGVREEELDLSNWFIRRIEDHMPEGLAVLGAKTGYVSMAGSCAASFAQSRDGREYICVTAKASGGWQCIFDQAAIYAGWAGR